MAYSEKLSVFVDQATTAVRFHSNLLFRAKLNRRSTEGTHKLETIATVTRNFVVTVEFVFLKKVDCLLFGRRVLLLWLGSYVTELPSLAFRFQGLSQISANDLSIHYT